MSKIAVDKITDDEHEHLVKCLNHKELTKVISDIMIKSLQDSEFYTSQVWDQIRSKYNLDPNKKYGYQLLTRKIVEEE